MKRFLAGGGYYPGPAPPHATLDACKSAVRYDPPLVQRPGYNYVTLPLPDNAAIGDCAALCCRDWSCAAFTFNIADLRKGHPRLCDTSAL